MILMLDNYDSFTYNLLHYLQELGADVLVKRNDEASLAELVKLSPEKIVISPGPCTPNESGVCLDVLRHFMSRLPILGVCLGHQAIAQVLGGRVIRADQVMHGKTSPVYHQQQGLFKGIESPVTVTRYHSLVVEKQSLPKDLNVTAWTQDESGSFQHIMGIEHKELPVFGVQFHPESVLSISGHQLLANFLAI